MIVIDEKIPGLAEAIRRERPDLEVRALPGAAIDRAAVSDAEALIVRTRTRCDASLLEGSGVKLVGTATIGTDHIDMEWCEAHGIRVVSAPGCNAPAVMQYVACSLHAAGFDPKTQTLGVVGKGHIGSLVVDLYRRAGGRVLVCDPPRAEAGLDDEDYLPLESLLEQADAVTLHVPGGEGTRNLINAGMLGRLPRLPEILVNASRGTVVEPTLLMPGNDLTASMRLIIDTWPFEDLPDAAFSASAKAAMIKRAFIATPHIAGYSLEGKRRATAAMLSALLPSASANKNENDNRNVNDNEIENRNENENDNDNVNSYALSVVLPTYAPLADSARLQSSPSSFELLRNSYPLRHEPHPGSASAQAAPLQRPG